MIRRHWPGVCTGLLLLALTAARAEAYPQWQFTSGTARCNSCHYAPGGGGLVTSYARDAIGDELSTFAGDGNFLHGVVRPPSWLALGGDFRGASLAHTVQDPGGPTTALFPMQADLTARVAFGAGFSFQAIGGIRGQARDASTPVPEQNYQPIPASRLISREHFLSWQPEVLGPYLRVGRFFAPFGLRLAEHVTYVRRDLGFDRLQETYNLSGGFVYARSELHVTAFAPDFVRGMGSIEKGAAAYYEYRLLNDTASVAAQSRLAFSPGVNRFVVGTVGKLGLEAARLVLLCEVNLVHLVFDTTAVGTRQQLIGAAGLAALPLRGLMVTLLGERNQVDLQVRDSAWNAAGLFVNWFPYPHVELMVMTRFQFAAGSDATKTLLAQLHYFL